MSANEENETKTFRCVVHVTKQYEVFVEAEDDNDATCKAEDMSENEFHMDEIMEERFVKKCVEV